MHFLNILLLFGVVLQIEYQHAKIYVHPTIVKLRKD